MTQYDMQWSVIPSEMEAQFEYKSVEYAMREHGRAHPLAVLAGGSGSVQVTALDAFCSFPAPLKTGAGILASAPTHEGGVANWQTRVGEEVTDGALTKLLAQAAERAQHDGQPPVAIVLISAFYYVAIAAGLVEKGVCNRNSKLEFGATEVCDALAKLMHDPTSEAKDAANAARLHEILHRIFDPAYLGQVRCFFARDWELDNGAIFRTTWTAGW